MVKSGLVLITKLNLCSSHRGTHKKCDESQEIGVQQEKWELLERRNRLEIKPSPLLQSSALSSPLDA